MFNLKELSKYLTQRALKDQEALVIFKDKLIETQSMESIDSGLCYLMYLDEIKNQYMLTFIANGYGLQKEELVLFQQAIKTKIAEISSESIHVINSFCLIPLSVTLIEEHAITKSEDEHYVLISENKYSIELEALTAKKDVFMKDDFLTKELDTKYFSNLYYTIKTPIILN